jgi:hypothetical protein
MCMCMPYSGVFAMILLISGRACRSKYTVSAAAYTKNFDWSRFPSSGGSFMVKYLTLCVWPTFQISVLKTAVLYAGHAVATQMQRLAM